MSDTVKLPGAWVKLGNKKYLLPPLNLKSIRLLQQDIVNFGKVTDLESLTIVAKVAHAGLARNYPDITLDEVEENVDLGNMMTLMSAAMGQSGLVEDSGEAQGEVNP